MTEIDDRLGPVEFLVVEFANGKVGGEGFAQLNALVEQGQILVLDLEFVLKSAEGDVAVVEASTIVGSEVDLSAFAGASAHLIDGEDVAAAGELIAVGSVAMVLVYEVLTVLPMIAAWERAGASLVAIGAVEFDDLDAALTAAESKEA